MWATLVKHAPIAAEIVRLFHARFDPRLDVSIEERKAREAAIAAAIEAALQQVAEPRRGPHPAPLRQRGAGGAPHQFLPARRRRAAEAAHRHQVRQPQARRPAAAAAALRDLRLFAARRGRASALRQGRARRHPLVRPAAGFPHRGARPGQGAAGQERRDRAGRRQGRLRAEASARIVAAAARARRCRPKAPPPTSCSSRPCSTSPTISAQTTASSRPPTSCATTTTIPISWSPPTRAPRPSPTSPTRSRSEHRLLARRRLRLRRLGRLRPQEDGHHRARRLGGGEAPFPRDGRRYRHDAVHRRRRRRHVGRRVRQRHAAGADRSSSSPPSTIATSSSIPRPIRKAASPSAQRLFELPRSSWQDYDKALISTGGGVFSRSLKEIALSPEAQAALGFAKAKATPQEVMNAILKAPVDLLFFGGIGTYVRASTETDDAVGDRANDAIRITGARAALQGDRRGRQSRHDPARPRSRRRCAASGSTPTPSTIRPASTPPTSRSTSRSRWRRRCATAGSRARRATRCSPR